MRREAKLRVARIMFALWLAQVPVSAAAFAFGSVKLLLGYNLALSVWTGIEAAKGDLDTLKDSA